MKSFLETVVVIAFVTAISIAVDATKAESLVMFFSIRAWFAVELARGEK